MKKRTRSAYRSFFIFLKSLVSTELCSIFVITDFESTAITAIKEVICGPLFMAAFYILSRPAQKCRPAALV